MRAPPTQLLLLPLTRTRVACQLTHTSSSNRLSLELDIVMSVVCGAARSGARRGTYCDAAPSAAHSNQVSPDKTITSNKDICANSMCPVHY